MKTSVQQAKSFPYSEKHPVKYVCTKENIQVYPCLRPQTSINVDGLFFLDDGKGLDVKNVVFVVGAGESPILDESAYNKSKYMRIYSLVIAAEVLRRLVG